MRIERQHLAIGGLLAVSAGFVLAAQHFAARGAWGPSLVAAVMALVVGGYAVIRAWPHLPRPALSYQFTRHAAWYVAAVFAVAFGALSSGNNLLFLVLAAMLAALLVSGLFSRLNLAELELRCAVPDHVFAGQDVPARLVLRNWKSWLPSFSIRLSTELPAADGAASPEVYFPMLAGGETRSTILSLRFPQRGHYRQEAFGLHSGFPFGFLVRTVRLELRREILVYPSVAPAEALEAALPRLSLEWERRQAGLGTDLYRIRPYQVGDSSRVVHWKASAHTGELKVREFSAEEDRRVEIVFDASVPAGEEWPPRFERGVNLCASLAWRLHTMGAGVRFRASGSLEEQPEALENVYDILRYLALVEAAVDGAPLAVEPSGWFQVVFTASAATRPRFLPESSYYCYYLENL